jgi:hypothetical protein
MAGNEDFERLLGRAAMEDYASRHPGSSVRDGDAHEGLGTIWPSFCTSDIPVRNTR